MLKLDSAFNHRISMGHKALVTSDIGFFGTNIIQQGTYSLLYNKNFDWDLGYFFIDNDYIYIFITYGVVLCSVILFIYYYSIKRMTKENNVKLFVWVVVTLIFALVNSSLISIEFNPLILVLVSLFFKKKEKKECSQYGI